MQTFGQRLTYLLRADLIGDRLDLIVAEIQLGQLIGFPPVFHESQFLEDADIHREDFKTFPLQAEHPATLGALKRTFDRFSASWLCRSWGTCPSRRIRLCLGCVVNVRVMLRGSYRDFVSTEVVATGLFEEVCVRLASHFCEGLFVAIWINRDVLL